MSGSEGEVEGVTPQSTLTKVEPVGILGKTQKLTRTVK
jgi:hypothetical protein